MKKTVFRVIDGAVITDIKYVNGPIFYFQFSRGPQYLRVVFRAPRREYWNGLNKFEGVVGGVNYKFRYRLNTTFLYVGRMDHRKEFDFLYYVMNLFRTRIESIQVDLREFRDVKKFMSEPCFDKVLNIGLIGRPASSKKLKELTDGLSGELRKVEVETAINHRIESDSILFRCNSLAFATSRCLTRDNLLNINAKYTVLKETRFVTDDAIEFVRHWFNGNNSRIHGIFVHSGNNSIFSFDRERILNEFETVPFDPVKRARRFVFHGEMYKDNLNVLDCTDGNDIERSDGLLATIKFWPSRHAFHFYVWHDRFPVVPDTWKTTPWG